MIGPSTGSVPRVNPTKAGHLTIFVVHSSYLEGVLAIQDTVVEKFIPKRCSCKPRARKLSEWMKIEAINDAGKTVRCEKTHSHDGCSVYIKSAQLDGHVSIPTV